VVTDSREQGLPLVSQTGVPHAHATIDVRFELSIDDDKTLPLATLARAVTDQNLEAVLLESLVEASTPPASRGALW